MQKNTQELLHQLTKVNDILKYLDENGGELINETPCGYLNALMQDKGLRAAEVARCSGQGEYVYKVLQGTRKASRNIFLAIAIGMGLTLSETQLLLRIAQTAQLDPRNRRDSVIIYALNHTLTTEQTNGILFDMDQSTL